MKRSVIRGLFATDFILDSVSLYPGYVCSLAGMTGVLSPSYSVILCLIQPVKEAVAVARMERSGIRGSLSWIPFHSIQDTFTDPLSGILMPYYGKVKAEEPN